MSFAEHKKRAWYGVVTGLLLILFGVRLMAMPVFLLAPMVVGVGVWVTTRAFTRLLRLAVAEQEFTREMRTEFRRAFAEPDGFDDPRWSSFSFDRATLPRQVFWLLLAVAEVDGRPEHEEREIVRRFLLERFTDPITSADLQAWEAHRLPRADVPALVRHLRAVLTPPERETLFSWCCAVTFADGSFAEREHEILQEIAQLFGLSGPQARRIFLHTKHAFLSARGGWRSEQHERRSPPQPRGVVQSRAEALQILGLDGGASEEVIRKRHRQLVKQYHPDAHAHLGAVAAAEAAQRFREVQAAYELLTAR